MGRRTNIISVTKESEALKKLRILSGLSVWFTPERIEFGDNVISMFSRT